MSAAHVWSFLQSIHFLAISLWVGGIAYLCAIAAPAIHGSVASRAIAGEIVRVMLRRFNWVEITCALLLLITSFSSFRFVTDKKTWVWILIAIILVMGIATLFYAFHLGPRLEKIKADTPTLDTLSKDHPAKVEFSRLHKLYVRLMGLNLLAGIGILCLSVVVFK